MVEKELNRIESIILLHHWEVVKTVGESSMAVFSETMNAVRAAFALALEDDEHDIEVQPNRLAIAVHCGPVLVTTTNNRLDYFGATVRQAVALPDISGEGIALTEAVYSDMQIDTWLRENACAGKTQKINLPSKSDQVIQFFSNE